MFFLSHAMIFWFSTQMKIFLMRLQSLRNDKKILCDYVTQKIHTLHATTLIKMQQNNNQPSKCVLRCLWCDGIIFKSSKQRYIPSNTTTGNGYEVHSSKMKVNYKKLHFQKEFMSLWVYFSNTKIRNSNYKQLGKI